MEEANNFAARITSITVGLISIGLIVVSVYCLFHINDLVQSIPNVACILLGLKLMKNSGRLFYNGISEEDIERMNKRKKDRDS